MTRTEIGLAGVDGAHLDQDTDRPSPMRKWTLWLNGAKSFFEKPVVAQLAKKYPALYGTERYIAAFTTARHLSLS